MRGLEGGSDVARSRAFWTASKPAPRVAPEIGPDPPSPSHRALALAAALLAQSSFAPALTFEGATLPFVVLAVGWYGLRAGPLRGLAFGLIAGACEDALAGTSGIAWTFATAVAGLVAGRFARSWAADIPPALCAGAALLTLLRYAAFAVCMQLQGRPIALPLAHLQSALVQGAQAALLAALLLGLRSLAARSTPRVKGARAHRR